MKPKRVAIYVRVSTNDQSTDLQKEELAKYIEARCWNLIDIYEDKATGTNGNRPDLKRLLKDARERRFDILCIWKLDRLFRSLKELVTTLQELSDLGIEFISLKDSIDLTTASGRLLMQMIGAFAEFEASLIRERVKAGLDSARRKGTLLGRPKVNKTSEIQNLRSGGLSIRSIAAELAISPTTVQEILKVYQKNPSKIATVF